MTTMAWTTVLREPKVAAEAAELQEVVLERRDGPNLVLGSEARHERRERALALVGRLIADWDMFRGASPIAGLEHELPWMAELPPEQRQEFTNEFARILRSAAELKKIELITDCVEDWRATAAVYADPVLRERLRAPLEGGYGARIPRPVTDVEARR